MQRAVDTTVSELKTAQVFKQAAKLAGGSASDLRRRTQVGSTGTDQIVTITVGAPTLAQAVRETDAFATSAIESNSESIQSELNRLRNNTEELIAGSRLESSSAERARVARLGDELGSNQSALVSGTRQLVLVQAAEGRQTTPGPALLAAMGFVGGALAGLVAAYLLGGRRERSGSIDEVTKLYPHLSVVSLDNLDVDLGLELATVSTVIVAALSSSAVETRDFAAAVSAYLSSAGYPAQLTEPSALRQHVDKSGENRQALAVIPAALGPTLNRIGFAQDVLLLVVVHQNHASLEILDDHAELLGDHTYLLVIDPSSENWEW